MTDDDYSHWAKIASNNGVTPPDVISARAYEFGYTTNPLGIKPTGPILPKRTKFM